MNEFEELLGNKSIIKLVTVLFENPSKEYYEKELAETSGTSVAAANMHLKTLTKKGFVTLKKRGKMNYYTLNRNTMEVKALKLFYTLVSKPLQEIKKQVKNTKTRVFMYGSVARGEDTERSDIDLLVIGILSEQRKVLIICNKTRSKKLIKPKFFTLRNWNNMRINDPAFYERVTRDGVLIHDGL